MDNQPRDLAKEDLQALRTAFTRPEKGIWVFRRAENQVLLQEFSFLDAISAKIPEPSDGWTWIHVNVDQDEFAAEQDEFVNVQNQDTQSFLSWLELYAHKTFSGARDKYEKMSLSRYSQQPEAVAGKDWDLLNIRVFPHSDVPESEAGEHEWWNNLPRLEARRGSYCLRLFVSIHILVTLSPTTLREGYLRGEERVSQFNPVQGRILLRLLEKFVREGASSEAAAEENVAFLVQGIFSGLLDHYDQLAHRLEDDMEKHVDEKHLKELSTNVFRGFLLSLAHMSKMVTAYERLFSHLQDPSRGAFQVPELDDEGDKQATLDRESDLGISRALQQRAALATRLLDELTQRARDYRDLQFSLETKRTNASLEMLTIVVAALAFVTILGEITPEKLHHEDFWQGVLLKSAVLLVVLVVLWFINGRWFKR